jgi:hypothetical protein
VIASDPLVYAKQNIIQLAAGLDEDLRGPVLALKEDLLSGLKLLDGVVYGNVFVGVDRQILGTKIDYGTPRVYLQDSKDALDTIIEIAGSL